MTFEFRGADLSDSNNWQDFAEILDFQRSHHLDDLEDVDGADFWRNFIDEDLDSAKDFIKFLDSHELPAVRAEAGQMAFDLLPHDEELATSIILKTFEDSEVDEFYSFAHDAMVSSEGFLCEVRLNNLAKIIRAYKQATSKRDTEVQ